MQILLLPERQTETQTLRAVVDLVVLRVPVRFLPWSNHATLRGHLGLQDERDD